MTRVPSDALVFFGATGDLAYKKIFPALQRMIRLGSLDVPVIGVSRGGFDLVVDVPHHYGGRYLHDVALPLAGQWEARVHIVAQGREYRLRERIHLEP
jgi:hypothetical protein